jgi:hypothetical protein
LLVNASCGGRNIYKGNANVAHSMRELSRQATTSRTYQLAAVATLNTALSRTAATTARTLTWWSVLWFGLLIAHMLNILERIRPLIEHAHEAALKLVCLREKIPQRVFRAI